MMLYVNYTSKNATKKEKVLDIICNILLSRSFQSSHCYWCIRTPSKLVKYNRIYSAFFCPPLFKSAQTIAFKGILIGLFVYWVL